MKFLNFWALALLIVCLPLQCYSSDANGKKNSPQKRTLKLVSKILRGNGDYHLFTYDDSNRLTGFSAKDGSNLYSGLITYTNDKITKLEIAEAGADDLVFDFFHSDNIIFVTVNGNKTNIQTIELNEKGQAKKIIGWDGPGTWFELDYDSNGNVLSETIYNEEGKLDSKNIVVYDNKAGFFKDMNVPVWLGYYAFTSYWLSTVNNELIEKTYQRERDTPDYIYASTYEYDEDNYPISCTTFVERGEESTTSTLTIAYYKKEIGK